MTSELCSECEMPYAACFGLCAKCALDLIALGQAARDLPGQWECLRDSSEDGTIAVAYTKFVPSEEFLEYVTLKATGGNE